MRKYNRNWGKLLFLRWISVGWTLQGVHSLDRTEKLIRIIFEAAIIAITNQSPVSIGNIIHYPCR